MKPTAVLVSPAAAGTLDAPLVEQLCGLLRGDAADSLPGRWEALSKPGLGGRERWRWTLPDGRVAYLKRYRHTPLRTQLDRMLRQSPRHSRAWWEFQQAAQLAEAQVGVPAPLACIERMSGLREAESLLLMAAVAGEAFDRAWLRAVAEGSPLTRGPLRHDVCVRLARFVSALHNSGLCHRDLYLCHVFIDFDPRDSAPPRFAVIDLGRTMRPKLRRMRWLLKDLAALDTSARQIGATRGDRLRFLTAYLGLQRRSPRLRWYARRIVRRSNQVLARITRKAGS